MTCEDLLLEIGVEEMPARFLGPTLTSLQERARSALQEARLAYESLRTLGTPRRLVLHVAGLMTYQSALEEEVRGPSRQAAYDPAGAPTRAALGFARSQGVPVEALQVRTTSAGEYVYAVRRDPGRPAVEVLPAILQQVVNSLEFARPMRWGNADFRFIRPIRWLLALYGGQAVPLEVGGVASGRETYGHRTMAPGPHWTGSVQEYFRLLPSLGVVLDGNERRQRIAEQVRAMAAATGGSSLEDDELLGEVADLVEHPTAFVGSFDRRYLALPAPVLVTTLRHHQRVFPVRSAGGGLLPVFVGVRNGDQRYLDVVRAGYERVIGARLADAEFFFQQDTKIALADRLPELSRVVFMENLGTLHDKTLRVRQLSRVLAAMAGVREGPAQVIDRAALLCKADLITAMVRELPELQGIMGREYATRSGEDPAVAEAIYEHYLPRTADDGLPGQLPGMLVGLADRLDTLAGCFGLGIQPTGSQDPYGLRRQALGVALLLWNSELHLDLEQAVSRAVAGQPLDLENPGAVSQSVLEFIVGRIRTLFTDAGVRQDVVDAVIAAGAREVPDAWRRSTVLAEFARKEEFEALMTGYRRVANLAGRATGQRPDATVLKEAAERELLRALSDTARKVKGRLEARDYQGYLKLLAGLKPHIDRFLDDVLVLAEDETLRASRLALLAWTLELFSGMADLRLLQPVPPG
ncbi:MAG: glycine--tRNA ligase subunit beta [Bacillota bacterium]